MNALMLLTGLFALAAAGSAAWAVVERGRAARAEERARALEADARMLEERARLVEANALTLSQTLKAQAAQSAQAVADALVKRASETFEAQERLAQARLEAQLKPVAETLAKFQEQVGGRREGARRGDRRPEGPDRRPDAGLQPTPRPRPASCRRPCAAAPACRGAGASRRCATCWRRPACRAASISRSSSPRHRGGPPAAGREGAPARRRRASSSTPSVR